MSKKKPLKIEDVQDVAEELYDEDGLPVKKEQGEHYSEKINHARRTLGNETNRKNGHKEAYKKLGIWERLFNNNES